MNRPGSLRRLAGSPVGALVLFMLYAAIEWGWHQGDVAWWVALGTLGAAARTLGAIRDVRRYKAWAAQWRAAGGNDAPRRPKKKRRGWLLAAGAALLVVGIPAYVGRSTPDDEVRALAVVWGVACLYLACCLLWKLFGLSRRVAGRSSARRAAEAEAAPVAWLLHCASSSPSRAEAVAELPEYSARLMGPV
jgi:hypothetical protein